MQQTFGLAHEPWIPCILPEGTREQLSLRDILVRAHDVREIRDDCPLVTVALHRLLLAILNRVFGPTDIAAWERQWKAGRFDPMALDAYFGRWEDRFDLIHPKHPFFQTPGLPQDNPVSIWRLAMVQGNNATLFDHRMEHENPSVEPAEAARMLVAYQAFAIGGGVSKPFNLMHGPLVRDKGFLTLVLGTNLFETLWLNAVPPSLRGQIPATSGDAPAWERDAPREPIRGGTPIDGYMDYLTWPSRRILLVPDEGELLRFSRMVLVQGLALPESPVPLEPLASYERNKDGDWRARSFEEGRGLWRDSHVLFQATGDTRRPPAAMTFLADLKERRIIPEESLFRLAAMGMSTDQAKILLWRHETLPLPLAYLGEEPLLSALSDAIGAAEAGAGALHAAVWATADLICPGSGKSKERQNRVRDVAQGLQADTRYWARLEQPFRPLLVDLPECDVEARLGQWRETVVKASQGAFDEIKYGLGDSSRVLRAIYSDTPWGGEKTLRIRLSKLASRQDKENSHELARTD
jgi:CRISPR system Cascade subunit CasA